MHWREFIALMAVIGAVVYGVRETYLGWHASRTIQSNAHAHILAQCIAWIHELRKQAAGFYRRQKMINRAKNENLKNNLVNDQFEKKQMILYIAEKRL